MVPFLSKPDLHRLWQRLWMLFSGQTWYGRRAYRLAALFTPPYYGRVQIAQRYSKGYISLLATLAHARLLIGKHCYLDDFVVIFQDKDGGAVELKKGVHVHRDTIIQTGREGSVCIGEETCLQPRCLLSAYCGAIQIGSGVEIGANCAFYSYNHMTTLGKDIRLLPLESKGGIVLEDGAWLGFGVTVLDGVRIGHGAVIGAGAVVTGNIPDNAIAAGVPARVLNYRGG